MSRSKLVFKTKSRLHRNVAFGYVWNLLRKSVGDEHGEDETDALNLIIIYILLNLDFWKSRDDLHASIKSDNDQYGRETISINLSFSMW